MRRFSLVSIVAALSLAASASTATAQVPVGQVGVPDSSCATGDWAQPTVSSGTSYVIPVTDTLTSWSHFAKVLAGQKIKLKVFRQVAGLTYSVVGRDGPRDLVGGALNTFATNIPVQAGDVLGMTTLTPGTGCSFGPLGETVLYKTGDAPDGAQVTFETLTNASRLNISAVIGSAPAGAPIAGASLFCKGQRATAVGTNGPDEIVGTSGRDVIAALEGNDKVSGLAGGDLICGGAGKDTLKGGKGKDTLLGQKGKDNLKGGGGKDVCKGGKGNDTASKCEVEKSI